ncbi:MFS general substrate transporter [Marasmius fiardii PR-910]|nr:MFS general substrate transporter [Marasmius fiardii PR-910]
MATRNERTPLLSGGATSSNTQETLLQGATRTRPSNGSTVNASEAHNIIYERFSRREKLIIVVLVSFVGISSLFVTGSFYPSIPDIAKDLNTSVEIVNRSVSVAVFGMAIGAFVGASFSSFYGRKPVYLGGLPLFVIGSLGVGISTTINQLMAWRLLQTIGCSFAIPVGAATIGDLYRLEERGTAMGFYFSACLIGPTLAPLVGGLVTHYASWRAMQACLGASGLVGFTLVALFMAETSFPGSRGIDKRRAEMIRPGETDSALLFTFPNPFSALALLRSPIIVAVSLVGWTVLMANYVIILLLPSTIAKRYGIVNQAAIGLLYVPNGLGNFVGAPIAGWLSDQVLKRMLKKRGGVWCPEDRLRPSWIGVGVLVPLSVLGVGIATQYVPGRVGLGLDMICLFFNGVGLDMVFSPSAAYLVDIVHSRSAESMAASRQVLLFFFVIPRRDKSCENADGSFKNYRGFRAFGISIGVFAVAPAVNHFGVLETTIIAALICWVGFGLLCVVIRYGEKMRSWVDVGYSTAETN